MGSEDCVGHGRAEDVGAFLSTTCKLRGLHLSAQVIDRHLKSPNSKRQLAEMQCFLKYHFLPQEAMTILSKM